jgi:ferritin-like metal-binding protein YciE
MITNLEQLYYDQIRDLYSAETQLISALPVMISNATSVELRKAFSHHLEETKQQRNRLEEISVTHGFELEGADCEAMRGLIREAKKHINDTIEGDVRDAVLIASGNRIEHYEIAAYGVARSFSRCLDFWDDSELLDESLCEESAADDAITKVATGGLFSSGVNEAAV